MKVKRLIERIERLVFGVTAQERVNLMAELAVRRAETRRSRQHASDWQ